MKKNNSPPMRQMILDFPKQFKVGLGAAKEIQLEGSFKNIVVSGMGGSAWPCDVLFSWLPEIGDKVFINRTYNIPQWAGKKTLFIFVSYSGNTEEPISSYNEAIKKSFIPVAIASGGKLKELSQKNKNPIVSIPVGLPPRLATGYIFSALVSILSQAKIIKDKSKEILKMASGLEPKKLEEKGEKIAKKLFRKIPIIYTPDRFKSLGYVWKAKLNENSKIPTFINYFSEMNHNEISGWERPLGKFFIIFLRDLKDHSQMLERIKFTDKFVKSRKIETAIIDIAGEGVLSRIFNTILLADWVSYYLAIKYHIDPLSLEAVERLKKYLAEKTR